MKSVARNVGERLAADAVGTLSHTALEQLQRAYLLRRAEKNLRAMEADYPELRHVPEAERRKAYVSVVRHAPRLAADPYLGGELVYNLATKNRRVNAMRDAAALAPRSGRITGAFALGNDIADAPGRAVAGALSKTSHYVESNMKKMDKSAAFSSETKEKLLHAGLPLVSALGAAMTSYAVPAAIEAVRAARIRANRDKYLEEMKKVHPDMRSIADQDLHIAYNSIAQHTPDVLKDPLLGGQTLKQMAQFRMANVQSLNEISRLRGIKPLDNAIMNATGMLSQGMMDSGKSYLAHTGDVARAAAEQARHADNLREKRKDRKLRGYEYGLKNKEYELKKQDSEQHDAQVADEIALNRAKFDAEMGYKREELDRKNTVEELKATIEALKLAPRTTETKTWDPNTNSWKHTESLRQSFYEPNAHSAFDAAVQNVANISSAGTRTTYSAPQPTFVAKKRK